MSKLIQRAVFGTLLFYAPSVSAQEVHVNFRAEIGGVDSNYPSCHGAVFGAAGGSVEIGHPFFAELLAEATDISSIEQCLPGRPTSDPDLPFAGVMITSPTYRLSAGLGHRFLSKHLAVVGRGGQFLTTHEPFISGGLTFRAGIFTLGFEMGQIKARWKYADGFQERRWSKFSGVSLGLRR